MRSSLGPVLMSRIMTELARLVVSDLTNSSMKKRNSKRRLKENKARQIFRKTNISYPLVHTQTYMYQGERNARFSKIWRALFSFYPCFEIDLFYLITNEFWFDEVQY